MPFLDHAIQVSIVLSLALGVTRLLIRRSASVRHAVLTIAVLCAILLPALTEIAPWEWGLTTTPLSVPFPDEAAPEDSLIRGALPEVRTSRDPALASEPAVGLETSIPSASPIDLSLMLLAVWVIGFGFNLSVIVIGALRLKRIARRATRLDHPLWQGVRNEIARRYGLTRPVMLIESSHPPILVTWGVLRPRIVVPRGACDWEEDRVRLVLGHEMAHIRRGDWPIQMTAELLRSFHWFNPLAWWTCRRLRQDSEQASDDAVLALGIAPSKYAGHLVELARTLKSPGRIGSLSLAMAGPSALEKRIHVMLNSKISHRAVTKSALGFMLGIALCLIPPVAGIRASVQGEPSASINGVVLDMTGARVPGVYVGLESEAAPIIRISNEIGEYRIPDVPPGEYLLVVRLPGFTDHRQDVVIGEGQELLRDVLLSVGGVATAIEVVSDRLPPEEPAESSESDRYRVTAGVTRGNIISMDQPVYPPHLRAEGVEGSVVLEGMIGADGIIAGLKVVSTDHADLAIAALDAVRRWRYEPSRLNAAPVAVATRISISFGLN